jgi:ubiquinone/menaquinone biosynthesis C-methylase UbiE/superfamily II DNA or RNA helicase
MSKSWKYRVFQLKNKAKENLKKKIDWCEQELISRVQPRGKTPFPGQMMRVYEAVENGTKRILFADATGFGKTYVTSMILGMLNKKKRKRHKTLLIAPQQSIETAWTEQELNNNLNDLNLNSKKLLKVAPIKKSNLEKILKSNDIISANYHKFNCATSNQYLQSVLNISKDIDLIIFDESQNYTSFGKRGINLKRIIDATRNKRIISLSANPGKNGLEDLGVPLHILDEKFPFAPYDYPSNPTAVKQMIMEGKWFNSDRNVVRKLFNLPLLTIHEPHYCEIGRKYAQHYLNVWQDGDLDIGSKIARLRKSLLLGKIISKEGKKDLEELLESFPKDDALITFTHLKTGVDEILFNFLERFYGKNTGAMINGDVKSVKERVKISEKFTAGEYKWMANSLLTMSEGIPCTSGERPAQLLFLEIPQNHGQMNQGIGRLYRPIQVHPVDVHFLLGENKWLRHKMTKLVESGELERKYGVIFGRNWRNTFIDFDIYNILKAKDSIDKEKVRNALTLDKTEQEIMSFSETSRKSIKKAENSEILKSLPKRKKRKKSAFAKFTQSGWKLYGLGEKELHKISTGEGRFNKESNYMFEAHADESILDTAAGDTARLIKYVAEGIEEKRGRKFKKLLDLGCGTGVVSRIFGREMTNIDLDERMLQVCKKYGHGPCKQGFLTKLPLRANQFDLVTASYVLFYLNQHSGSREMEKAFTEINRVLKYKGYFATSLIRTTSQRNTETIADIMQTYGLEVLVNDFFKGYNEDGRKSNFRGAYLLVGRKEGADQTLDSVDEEFVAYAPKRYMASRSSSRLILDDSITPLIKGNSTIKKVKSVEFKNEKGISLGKILNDVEV